MLHLVIYPKTRKYLMNITQSDFDLQSKEMAQGSFYYVKIRQKAVSVEY